jgi:hypothetical protein
MSLGYNSKQIIKKRVLLNDLSESVHNYAYLIVAYVSASGMTDLHKLLKEAKKFTGRKNIL